MNDIVIEEEEIHLWHLDQIDFDLPALAQACLSWLTDSELQRYHRYQFDRHRKQLLLARVLMRIALSRYDSSIAPASWKFSQNQYGKPAISEEQNTSSLYFNLSHSAEQAVLAVSRYRDIGVDIEFSSKPRRIEAIAQRYFSPAEAAAILSLPAEQQQDRFYDLWTLKEAYIKACGMGLAIPLQHFSYGFSEGGGLAIEFDPRREDSEQAWQFWQLGARSDYKLALAARTDSAKAVERVLSWQLEGLGRISECETRILRSK